MPVVESNGWTLVSKRRVGRRGYVFKAENTAIAGKSIARVKLVISVVNEGAQNVYFRELLATELDATEDGATTGPVWAGVALITSNEDEALAIELDNGATGTFTFKFDQDVEEHSPHVIVGKFPKITRSLPVG